MTTILIPPYKRFTAGYSDQAGQSPRLTQLAQQNVSDTLGPVVAALSQPGQAILAGQVCTLTTTGALPDVVAVPHTLGRAPVGAFPLLSTSSSDGWTLAPTPAGGDLTKNLYLAQENATGGANTFLFWVF